MNYRPPMAEPIDTTDLCAYGCNKIARYKFGNGKLCCEVSFNKCPKKRQNFSDRDDHKIRSAKSLATRVKLGITKTSQIKATETRKALGHYQKLSKIMQQHWAEKPWTNNLQCPLVPYKDTELLFQGTYEFEFLQELEDCYGLDWLKINVRRGPSIWFIDPTDQKERLYISDFIIDMTIYEIKSNWTWNKHGRDKILQEKNLAKLDACEHQGYKVILVLNGEKIRYVKGTLG